MFQYPRYSLEPIIELAQKRISHPKALEGKVTHYEHHVGSWACTMLARHFNTKDFLITTPTFTEPAAPSLERQLNHFRIHKFTKKQQLNPRKHP